MRPTGEVAKGELRAATYSELALRTSLTGNEPDRVDFLGKAPREFPRESVAWGEGAAGNQREGLL